MWIKQSNKWELKKFNPDARSIDGNAALFNLFSSSSIDNKAIVHIPTYDLNAPLEEYQTNLLDPAHKYADKNGFWAPGTFDADAALEYFGHYYYVTAASSDNTVYSNTNVKTSVDFIEDVNAQISSLTIDGIKINSGETILLKNQGKYKRALYNIVSTNKNIVSIASPEVADDFFGLNNSLLFFDINGTVLGTTTAYNIVKKSGLLNLYTIGDVPTGSAYVADAVRGNWEWEDLGETNGLYTFTGSGLVPCHKQHGEPHLVWVKQGETNKDKQFRLVRNEDKTYPHMGDSAAYEASSANILSYKLSYLLKNKPYRFLALDYTIASRIIATQKYTTTVDLGKTIAAGNQIILSPVRDYTPHAIDSVLKNLYGLSDVELTFTGVANTNEQTITFTHLDNFIDKNFAKSGFTGIDFTSAGSYNLKVATNDFVKIDVSVNNNSILTAVLLAQNVINGRKITLYPALNDEILNEILGAETYSITLRVINKVTSVTDLSNMINTTLLKDLYVHDEATSTSVVKIEVLEDNKNRYYDFNLNVYFKATSNATKELINTVLPTGNQGFGVKHKFSDCINTLTPDVLSADFPSVPNYALDSLLPDTFTYSTANDGTKFEISGNALKLGVDNWHLRYKYLPGLYLDVNKNVNAASTNELCIKSLYVDGEYLNIFFNKQIVIAPVNGDTITLKPRNIISDIDRDLTKSYELGNRSQEAYAAAIARDSKLNKHFIGVFFLDGESRLKVILNYNKIADSDQNLSFEPFEYCRVGADMKLSKAYSYKQFKKKSTIEEFAPVTNIRFLDGVSEENIRDPEHYQHKFMWVLDKAVNVENAIIGCTKINESGNFELGKGSLVWYEGTWVNGIWKGDANSEWVSGTWKNGTWENGKFMNRSWVENDYVGSVLNINPEGGLLNSVWENGTWKNGLFTDGATWASGSWRTGTFSARQWINGYWASGTWLSGIWKNGTWLNGDWYSGDFEKGRWYNGNFGVNAGLMSTFGGNSTAETTVDPNDSGRAHWYNGTWLSGKFKVGPSAVEANWTNHSASIWWSGIWETGTFEGGTMVHVLWKNGTWNNGIWLGGFKISALKTTEIANTVSVKLDMNHYTSILGASGQALLAHPFKVNNSLTFLGIAEDTNNEFYQSLIISNVGYIEKSIRSITSADEFVINNPTAGLSTVQWVIPSDNPPKPDGGPYVASVWQNGTFSRGTWVNGVWLNGTWNGGAWIAGYMENSTVN